MERFGGHHQAGGFTIRTERIEQLRTLLTEWAVDQCDWGAMTPSLDVDLQVSPAGGISAAQLLSVVEQLEPCGTLNPAPIFVARDALVREASLTADGRHLRMRLDAGIGKRPWPAIAFGLAAHRPRPGERVDIVYSINADRYGEAQMRVHDLAAGSA